MNQCYYCDAYSAAAYLSVIELNHVGQIDPRVSSIEGLPRANAHFLATAHFLPIVLPGVELLVEYVAA
jgi:hypothetical protein